MKPKNESEEVTLEPIKKKRKGAPYSKWPGVVNGRTTASLSITEETRRLLRQAGEFIYPHGDGKLSNNQYVHVSNLLIQAACESILRAPKPRTNSTDLWPVAFDARAESDDEHAVRMLFYEVEKKLERGDFDDGLNTL